MRVLGLSVLAVLVLAGCSSGGGSAAGKVAAGGAGGGNAAVPAVANAPARTGSDAVAAGTGRPPLVAAEVRIRTAELTVTVKGDGGAKADAADAVAERNGGEVDSDDRSGSSATLRLLVPPQRLVPALTALAALGNARSRQVSSRVVTQQVADVTSRVASARAAIARLTLLYQRSAKVSDVLAVESDLSRREADLEALEAQQRVLSQQTASATITLYLRKAAPAVVHHHHASRHGFLGGLAAGWSAFVHTAGAVATAFGAALPFLVVLLAVALGVRLLWPRGRRPAPVAATPPAD